MSACRACSRIVLHLPGFVHFLRSSVWCFACGISCVTPCPCPVLLYWGLSSLFLVSLDEGLSILFILLWGSLEEQEMFFIAKPSLHPTFLLDTDINFLLSTDLDISLIFLGYLLSHSFVSRSFFLLFIRFYSLVKLWCNMKSVHIIVSQKS